MKHIKKILLLLLIPITILVFISIKNQLEPNNSFNKKVSNKNNIEYLPIASEIPNVSYSILNKDGTPENLTTYRIKESESFEKFINIANFVDFDREYKLLTLINYQKSDFFVDDVLYKDFTINMKKNSDLQIPIKLNPLKKGAYDIIFAIVKDPNYNLTDEERKNSEMNHTLFIRFTLVVDNGGFSDSPVFEELESDNLQPIPDIFLHKDKNELKQFPSINLENSNTLNFYLTIGNPYKDDIESFAIILFQDYNQINIIENKNVIFVKLNPNEKVTIPINIDINEEKQSNINAIAIKDPFKEITKIDESIQNTIRLGAE